MRIESAANPLIKRIRALEQRKGREEQGAFFVEGIQAVWQAVEAGAAIETLVVAPELLTSAPALAMVAQQRRRAQPSPRSPPRSTSGSRRASIRPGWGR